MGLPVTTQKHRVTDWLIQRPPIGKNRPEVASRLLTLTYLLTY